MVSLFLSILSNVRQLEMVKKMKMTMILVLAAMGCSGVTIAPATSRPPVSGDDAREGAVCELPRAIGARCTIEDNRCPQGGFRPARYTCLNERWTCQEDRSESCPTTTMRTPDCRDREFLGTCAYSVCLNGSGVLNGRNTCIAGAAYCLPDPNARCPTVEVAVDAGTSDASAGDAGITDANVVDAEMSSDVLVTDVSIADASVTDAGIVDVGTPDTGAVESRVLSIRYDGPASGSVYAGSNDARFQRTTLNAERDLEIDMRFRVEATSATGFLSDSSGNVFLRDVKLIDEGTGRVLSGPIELRPGPNARTMFLYMERFTIRAGHELRLGLTADVPYRFNPSLSETRFRVVADGGNGHFFADGAVRTTDGTIVSPEAITDNVVIPGNEFTLRRPSLTVGLASEPRSHTATKRALNVPSADVVMTANPGSDIHATRLRLTGVGDVGYGFRQSDFHLVVTACTLYDGSIQVSSAQRPDDMYGRLEFRDINLMVPRGTTHVYRVACTTDSVVDGALGDRFAIGMVGNADIDAEDSIGTGPDIVVQSALQRQLTDEPPVVVTVVQSGSLSLRSEVPTLREYEGGHSDWRVVGYYNPTSGIENVSIDRFAVRIAGNSACVSQIGMMRASGGEPFATNTVPAGRTSAVDLEPVSPFMVTPGGADLLIVARFNPTVSASVDPSGCLSGSVLNFSLAVGLTAGEWDENYRMRYNVRAVGMTSGERIYVAMPAPVFASAVIIR